MDWSRIKTIFIVAFLILDVYLVSQLLTKMEQYEIKDTATFDENLNADGIEYSNLPEEYENEQYLSGNTKKFTEEERNLINGIHLEPKSDTVLRVELFEPILIEDSNDLSALDEFIHQEVLYGDEYRFWSFDREKGEITYFQTVNGKFLLFNKSAQLTFYVNEINEIVAYEQTMLESIEPFSDEESVISPLKALESLYSKGTLKPNSTIITANIGYYTLVNMEAFQVLTPTWYFEVERDGQIEYMLVNALEGSVIQMQSSEEKS